MKKRHRHLVRTPALVFACFLAASTASANSRFPRAERLIENPTDPNKLYLAATFGIMTTADRGQNWYHVCEAAFSFQTKYGGDPVLSLLGDNSSLLVGTQASFSLSTSQGCDWTQTLVSQASPKQSFFDFTVSPSTGHPIFAVATTYETSGPVNQLEESTDNGATWKLIGTPMPIVVFETLDVDPTDPMHIIATGLTTGDESPNTGVFLTSSNQGATWTSYPIPNTYEWAAPYIAGVHPTDPNKIFVRTDGWKNRDVVQTADDALLYSADGGKTWSEILHAGGPANDSGGAKLFGFALSPDGSTVLAGYGDPVDSSRSVEGSWFGVYKSSSDGKYSFGADPANPTALLPAEAISCITWTKNGIYVCMAPQGEPSFVGFAKDPTFTARAQMTTLMRADLVRGVPPGCSGRATSTCSWDVDCVTIGACDAGVSTGGAGGGPGAATSTTTGGTGPTGAGGGSANASSESPKSCACRSPGGRAAGSGAAAWLLGAMFFERRRRSRRSVRQRS
jgi:hypothetical protein